VEEVQALYSWTPLDVVSECTVDGLVQNLISNQIFK
jgi:hypothetical protein